MNVFLQVAILQVLINELLRLNLKSFNHDNKFRDIFVFLPDRSFISKRCASIKLLKDNFKIKIFDHPRN